MNASARSFSFEIPSRLSLALRILIVAGVIVFETLLRSALIEELSIGNSAGPSLHGIARQLFQLLIAYAASLATIAYLARGSLATELISRDVDIPVRVCWCVMHALLLLALTQLSTSPFGGQIQIPVALFSFLWVMGVAAAALALLSAMAPLAMWWAAFRSFGLLAVYAILPATAALIAIRGSQSMWTWASHVTFTLVRFLLGPIFPRLHTDVLTKTVSTDRFVVTITDMCSGLEGVGLVVVFCSAWLWYFRRDYFFPRALLVIPVAALLVFFLNAVRIGALLLIGDAGYGPIASAGFHSQAGWIAFNLVAMGVAFVSSKWGWLNRKVHALNTTEMAHQSGLDHNNPVAPYLMPLLSILGIGMLIRAGSPGFTLWYPLKFVAAVAVLGIYRSRYKTLDWHFGPNAIGTGIAIFIVWILAGKLLIAPQAIPEALLQMSLADRTAWTSLRIGGAVLTVPIAEELAFRGYLLRRLVKADFESIPFQDIRWPALVLSAVFFGATHGALWLPGIAAGSAYGLLAIRSGRIGDAVVAHATTNALLALYVISFDQWQLW